MLLSEIGSITQGLVGPWERIGPFLAVLADDAQFTRKSQVISTFIMAK